MKKAFLLRSCAAFFVPIAAGAILATPAMAQETTSSISGVITSKGAPVPNATVTITHVPSGTVSTVTTSADGAFSASGLRVGGPYTVNVASRAGSTRVTDVYTVAGQPYNLPVDITPEAPQIVVTATRLRGAGVIGTGPSTVLNANDISKVATVNRDIRDLMRRDPFATLDTSQSTGRQVTFAGTNPRFNRFTVDGVPITDSFGLNPDALPSRRGPVPLDLIGEFQTKVAPYDIREGFFQGGVINAILRSGTNHFQGTGFYSINTDGLTGSHLKPYITNPTGFVPQPKFKSQDYGIELSGPIFKDRLFFMVAAERVRANNPFNLATSSITRRSFDQIVSIAKNKYGVDAGGTLTNQGDKDDRVVGRIDANLTDKQRLSVTGIYTKDQINTLGFNTPTSQSTLSNDYVKPNRLAAGVATLNSSWSDVLSTETRVMYKDYKSGQNPILAKTALALVCSDPGTASAITIGNATQCSSNVTSLAVGPLGSAQTNVLHTKTFDAQELVRLSFGDHNVRLLYDYQHVSNYNLFIGQTANPGSTGISSGAFGAYYFDFDRRLPGGYRAGVRLRQRHDGQSERRRRHLQLCDAHVRPPGRLAGHAEPDGQRRRSVRCVCKQQPSAAQSRVRHREGFCEQRVHGRSRSVATSRRFRLESDLALRSARRRGHLRRWHAGRLYRQQLLFERRPAGVVQYRTPGSPFLTNVSLTQVPPAATAALRGTQNAPVAAIDPNFKIPSQWRGSLSATYDFDFGPLGDHWILGASALLSKTREAHSVSGWP